MENYKVKFMCSSGGEILPHPHDNHLSYVGGHTKIMFVDRNIKFAAMIAKLSARFNGAASDVSLMYQLPGMDLDAPLISVTDDEDLDNMMLEYDQLHRASAANALMRLFLFPNNNDNNAPSHSLNSGPASSQPDPIRPYESEAKLKAVRIDEDGLDDYERDTFGSVDKPINASLELQLLPSKAEGVPIYAPVEMESGFHIPWGTSKDMGGCCASASSSCSFIGPLGIREKYDVFISFRGEDTRTNFTCHLHEAFSRKQIKTFIDYELHKGNEISPSLVRAIENSYVSVVVFSENYASSKWCLEELVKILECRKEHGQVVIPVFCDIDPSQVRKQLGSYQKAFEKHMQNFMLNMNKIQKWKNALTEAADLAGWDTRSRSYRDDSELIQKIVKDVLQKLDYYYPPNDFKGLAGIYRNLAPLALLLRDARSVGIWGMGGIGKTTIARYIFDKCFREYEGSCFLENVKEKSGEHGQRLHDLRNQLYSKLLNGKICQNSQFDEQRLRRQRNFIVLDDVSSSKQLEYLVGELQFYGPGSKIIITTRDKSVLENKRVEKIHEMEMLCFEESLALFSWNAFNEDNPEIGYKELSQRAVAYCKGIPLALTVLGSFLHSKSESEWNSALQRLERIPHEEIQNMLMLSYNGLNDEEQQMFLDIACFLKGELKERIINLFESYGLHAIIGIRSLHDKALITISGGFVMMHDLIQQMGWEIVRQESKGNPEKRNRLCDLDAFDVLKNNKGTYSILGITLDLSQCGQSLCLSADTFRKMPNLRYIKFFTSSYSHGRLCGIQLPARMESFSNQLRHFEWHACHLQSLPSNFCLENLVTLRMPNGRFEKLWSGVQNLVNLKEVNLDSCKELIELPDFSEARNLREVDLSFCKSLRHVHPSILSLGTLEALILDWCEKLESIESKIHFRSLSNLSVDGCWNLTKFSLSSEKITSLNLSQPKVRVLDSSIGRFSQVKDIDINGCRLENLPKELSCLKSLESLYLYNCNQGISKQHLHVIFNGLQSLRELHLEDCHYLFELPDNINHLSSLQALALDGSHVERLPESIKHLSGLERLSLSNCRRLQSLPELPSSIIQLTAKNCTLLRTVTSSLMNSRLQEQDCKNTSFQKSASLDVAKCMYSFRQYLKKLAPKYEFRKRRGEIRSPSWKGNFWVCYPDDRVPEWFTYQTKGASITLELADQCLDKYSSFLTCVVLSSCGSPERCWWRSIRCVIRLEDDTCLPSFFRWPYIGELDFHHVYMMSFDWGSILKTIMEYRSTAKRRRLNNQTGSYICNSKITFQFSFEYMDSSNDMGNIDRLIEECGIHPLNAPES